jgi:hypothetical protein
MDVISQELDIPKRQIKETKNRQRFSVIAHKSWLKSLSQHGQLAEFPVYYGLEDWPHGTGLGNAWQKVHITVRIVWLAEEAKSYRFSML